MCVYIYIYIYICIYVYIYVGRGHRRADPLDVPAAGGDAAEP